MAEDTTNKDIKNVKIIYIQQTLTGFDLMERADIHDKFSFSSTGSLKINFKAKPFYKGVEYFDTYLPFLLFGESNFIFTKPYDKEKAMQILLTEKEENVKWEIEKIDQDIKSLEFKKSQLLKVNYKKSDPTT